MSRNNMAALIIFPEYKIITDNFNNVFREVKDSLDLNDEDLRYDSHIEKAIMDNLIKISSSNFNFLSHKIAIIDSNEFENYRTFNIDLQGSSKIRSVFMNTNDAISGACISKEMFRCDKLMEGCDAISESPPDYYFISGSILSIPGSHYNGRFTLKIIYDGLDRHPYDGTIQHNILLLLRLGALRDMYRNVFKSVELFTLLDSSYQEEWGRIFAIDFSPRPLKTKKYRAYW